MRAGGGGSPADDIQTQPSSPKLTMDARDHHQQHYDEPQDGDQSPRANQRQEADRRDGHRRPSPSGMVGEEAEGGRMSGSVMGVRKLVGWDPSIIRTGLVGLHQHQTRLISTPSSSNPQSAYNSQLNTPLATPPAPTPTPVLLPPSSSQPSQQQQTSTQHYQPQQLPHRFLPYNRRASVAISSVTALHPTKTPYKNYAHTTSSLPHTVIRITPDHTHSEPTSRSYDGHHQKNNDNDCSSSTPPTPSASSSVSSLSSLSSSSDTNQDPIIHRIKKFFSQPWVRTGRPSVLFIKRPNNHKTRSKESNIEHLAFPGGRMEPEDQQDGLFCAMRETWAELGLDLSLDTEFIQIGRLDDREITTSLGKRLLMVLSPYVFLYIGKNHQLLDKHNNQPKDLSLDPSNQSTVHWVPLDFLIKAKTIEEEEEERSNEVWGHVTIDLSNRLIGQHKSVLHSTFRVILRCLIGSMKFRSILLPLADKTSKNKVHLWGLTLGMTLDLLSFFNNHHQAHNRMIEYHDHQQMKRLNNHGIMKRSKSYENLNLPPTLIQTNSPSITSIFPRFTHYDINGLIWILGKKYRKLMNEQMKIMNDQRPSRKAEQRMNKLNNRSFWISNTMNEFYKAVRKALIIGIMIRFSTLSLIVGWFGFKILKLIKLNRVFQKFLERLRKS